MAFTPPALNAAQLATLKQTVNSMEQALKSVLVVAPISSHRRGTIGKFVKTREDDDASYYDDFIRHFLPKLTEARLNGNNPMGLLTLQVAKAGDAAEAKGFGVDSSNYFYRRGASTTEQPAWVDGINQNADAADQGNWLDQHRGKNFIVELRKNLRTFCRFQHQNHQLVNAFVNFCYRVRQEKDDLGLGVGASNNGLPVGLAERLVDYFYLGTTEGKLLVDLNLAELADPQWTWTDESQEAQFRENFPRLAAAFRRGLLGGKDNMEENDWSFLPDCFENATKALKLESQKFQKAQSALTIIREMLPSRALPQETVAWLLETLCETACGNKSPTTTTEFVKVAAVIKEGLHEKIAAPKQAVLPAVERGLWKDRILAQQDKMIEILAGDGNAPRQLAALRESFGSELPHGLDEKSVGQLSSFIKMLAPPSSKDKERDAMLRGAKSFLANQLHGRIFPRLFSSPVMTLEELLMRLQGDNYSLMLQAGGESDAANEALDKVGDAFTGDVSKVASLPEKEAENRAAGLDAITPLVLFAQLQANAQHSAELRTIIELWKQAQELLRFSPVASSENVVSSLLALRPLPEGDAKDTALAHSPLAVGAVILRRIACRKLEVYRKLRAAKTEVEAARKAEAEAKEVDEAAKVQETEEAQADEKAAAAEAASAAKANVFNKTAELSAKETAFKDAQTQAAEAGILPKAEPAATKAASPAAEQGSIEAQIGEILRRQNIDLEAESEAPADIAPDSPIEKALADYLNEPANSAAVQALLKANESLNHKVFTKYADSIEKANQIAYCRQVEAMTLGRILMADRDRCRLAEESSGLLRLLCDLIQFTGLGTADGSLVEGLELLKSHSLFEYLDGAFLQNGKNVSDLKTDLQRAARKSFENITGFISELQGIRYLFHQAPVGSTISIFNGSPAEFAAWLQVTHLTGHGPFSVASTGSLPGLICMASSQGDVFSIGNELRRNGLGLCLPPVVSTRHLFKGSPPVPYLVVGPDFPLNKEEDEMPTKLPAPYPVLVAFLQGAARGAIVTVGLNENVRGNEAEGFDFNVAGVGSGVEAAVTAVFGTSFQSDYHLYVFLRLWAQLLLLKGGNMDGWYARASFDSYWFDDPAEQALWQNLDADAAAGQVAVKNLFASGSAKTCRFSGAFGAWRQGIVPAIALQLLDANNTPLNLPPWFNSAITQF